FYAVSRLKINGKWKNIRMHRLIMGVEKSSKPMVDHIDGNGLNNCRSNLRLATHSQNLQNADSRRGTSKYKGVYFSKQLQKYRAKIIVDKKEIMLGSYINEDDAARAYNYAAIEYFGEFARLNDVDMSIPITKNTIRKFRGVEPTQ